MNVAFNFLDSPSYFDSQLLVFVLQLYNLHLKLGYFVPSLNLLVVELFYGF